MKTLILLLMLVPRLAEAAGLLPILSTPSAVAAKGRPVRVDFKLVNVSQGDLYLTGLNYKIFDGEAERFFVYTSRGERVPPGVSVDLVPLAPSHFRLIRPGEAKEASWALTDGEVGFGDIGSSDMPDCYQVEQCMQIGVLDLPADTYRLKWHHIKNDTNPFETPEDQAKMWTGEVWSNTLIIQTTDKEPVKVGLDVDPDTLNFKSEGKWITAYLSAPQDADLIAGKTRFQGTIAADKVEWDQGSGAGGQWMIKFPRGQVIELLKEIRGWELDGMMKVFVSAESGDKMFWGDDKIRILEDPGNAPPNPPSPPGQGNPPSTPPGQDKKKSPRR